MTNVPEPIRQAWKELYILFDTSFVTDGSEQSWAKYWEQANKLIQKYGDDIPLLEMTVAIAHMIEVCNRNKSLTWNKGEAYPYPKGDIKNGN